MTSFVGTEGKKTVHDQELTTTNETTIVADKTGEAVERTIECIRVTCDGGTSTLSLVVKNGATTLFKIVDGITITESFSISDYPRPLRPEHKITATAGTANVLSASIIMIERQPLDRR